MAKIIALSGPVGWVITAKELRAELESANGGDVELHVNSPGGFVFESIEIFNLIRNYQGHIEARIVGVAASAASYFILAADRVSAYDNATFMMHNAINIVIGNHNDMRKTADILESLSNVLAKAYVAKTGKSIEDIKSLMDEETFLFGDEILHEGFVDEIIENPEGEDEHDRESAIIEARASIETCFKAIKESPAANEDFQRAVAYMNSMESTSTMSYDIAGYTEADFESGTEINPEAPFPNEHACRVRDPKDFQKGSFRRISRNSDGKTLDIIIGRLKGKTTTTTQAFRYPKDEWTESQARKHCNDHDGKLFEPATGKASADNGGCGGGT
jgi:ATP-dependent protease ClpP protease subunit